MGYYLYNSYRQSLGVIQVLTGVSAPSLHFRAEVCWLNVSKAVILHQVLLLPKKSQSAGPQSS